MKKSWIITVIYCLLIIGGGIFVVFFPRTVPFEQCSEVYKKYVDVEGIEASFIKDFRINDTLCLDVTVLKALDTNAWNMLKSDFHIREHSLENKKRIENGEDVISYKGIFKYDINMTSSSDNPIIALLFNSVLTSTITIFQINDESEMRAITQYKYPFLKK